MGAAIDAVSCQSGCFSKVFDFVLSVIQRKHSKPDFKVPGSICGCAGNAVMNREAIKRWGDVSGNVWDASRYSTDVWWLMRLVIIDADIHLVTLKSSCQSGLVG